MSSRDNWFLRILIGILVVVILSMPVVGEDVIVTLNQVETVTTGGHPSALLSYDEMGVPYILTLSNDAKTLILFSKVGNNWIPNIIDSNYDGSTPFRFAVDTQGNPHFCYLKDENRIRTSYYSRIIFGIREDYIFGTNSTITPYLYLDREDKVHFVYRECTWPQCYLIHSWLDGSDLISETIDERVVGLHDTDVAFDNMNNIYIAYGSSDGTYGYQSLKYAHKNGDDWIIENIDTAGSGDCKCSIESVSIDLDSNSKPHIAYKFGWWTSGPIKYAHLNDQNTWEYSIIENKLGGGGSEEKWFDAPKIVIDNNNQPLIAYSSSYHKNSYPVNSSIKLAFKREGNWYLTTLYYKDENQPSLHCLSFERNILDYPGLIFYEYAMWDAPSLNYLKYLTLKSQDFYPKITSLTPSSITAGSDAFTLQITGTNFVDGATVLWDGEERETQFVSETQLNATILKEDVSTNGTFKVKVINSDGKESNEVDFTIQSDSSLIAEFTASVASGPVPLQVTFFDQSDGNPESWFWEFGDGGVSNEQNPSHTYNSIGEYTVNLTINSEGFQNTDSKYQFICVVNDVTGDYLRIEQAAQWASDRVGPTAEYADHSLRFINAAYNNGSNAQIDIGIDTYEDLVSAISRLNQNTTPPRGAYVFYSESPSPAVALSLGDGDIIHVTADVVEITQYLDHPGYAGWSWPPISAPVILYPLNGSVVDETPEIVLKNSIWTDRDSSEQYEIVVEDVDLPVLGSVKSSTKSAKSINTASLIDAFNGICKSLFDPLTDGWKKIRIFRINNDGERISETHTVINVESTKKTLQEKAVELAKTVVGAPYQLGAKGYNLSGNQPAYDGRYVEAEEIKKNGYHWDWDDYSIKSAGIDCSGLIFWSYNKAAGVTKYLDPNNPTHPSDQWEKDIDPDRKFTYNNIPGQISKEPPTANDLQTGDLLFILVHSKPPGIGYMHVGMYAGNGEVIHSSGEGGVEIIKLEDWFDLGIGGTSYSYWDYFTGYGSISTESALQPKLVTDKVGQIDSSSAILKGHIENPEPGQTYTVCFRYEGGSTPKTKVGCTTVTSAKPSYEYTLMGLEPATTYYYRAVHTDSQGVGDDEKHPIDANNVESFSTSTTSQINTARVPEELLEKIDNYIEENPNFYYYDENWEISKDQYKLMITTLAWSEGNKAGYQAHSSDSYDRWHTELPMSAEGFHFSRGLGPFQITLGDIASKGMYPDIGRPWSNWKTIEKLNSTYALNSTLYRHKNTEKITNPEDIKDLESLRLTMIDDWYGYQYPTLGDWKTKWSEVTGTNWDNVKNSNESGDFLNGYQTSWSNIKTRLINNEKDNPWMSEDEAIKNIGTQKWIIQDEDNVVSATGTKVIIDDYLPTWRISSWKTEGTPLKCDYYYTCDERYGVEIWALAKDPRYIFTRTYTKDNPKDLTYYEFGAHSPDNSGLLLNHEPIIVEEEPEFSNVDVALIIDSSGSMTSTDPTNLRKEAAKLFIDLVDDEDKIAIVDFDENVRVWQSLIGIAGNKAALKTAVDRIDSSGSTNIGGGLRYGYNELNGAQADTTHNKAAILLTDGQHNTGTAPLSVVPDYEAKGWPIYSIALSSDADKQLLNQISDETDGQFYDAPESKALQDIYNKISLRIKGNSQVDVQTGQIREGQTVAGSVPIDSSVKAFNIVLTWPGSDLDLVLYNPDGSPVVLNQSSLSGTDNPDITYIAQNTYEIYKIQHPQPGTWRYDIIGIDVQNQEDYTLTLSASTTIRLDAVTNKQDYSLGEDVQITAELSDEYGGISGAYVTANVTTPDLSHEIIQISDYDNGIYHGIFLNTTQNGHYSIMVEAQKDDIIRQKQIEFEINMTLEPLPIANFTSNTTLGQIPLSIQFIDMSTGNITSRLWSFDDGTTAENETEVTHTYLQPGNYTVTLTVSGPDGEDSVSQAIQVTDDTIAKEFLVQLNGGWNIFSTPVKLEPGKSTFGEIFTPTEQQKIQVVLGWDEGYWFIPGPSTHVDPLYAYFIKIEDDTTATAVLVPSETATALPSRQMTEGINLIGPAPAYDENSQVFQTMPIDQGLVSIEHVGDLTGYVIVVSPHLNQPGWAYAKGGQVKDLLPFKGYWITMENGPDTMYGFSTTPM